MALDSLWGVRLPDDCPCVYSISQCWISIQNGLRMRLLYRGGYHSPLLVYPCKMPQATSMTQFNTIYCCSYWSWKCSIYLTFICFQELLQCLFNTRLDTHSTHDFPLIIWSTWDDMMPRVDAGRAEYIQPTVINKDGWIRNGDLRGYN